MKYIIRDREAGNFIDEFETLEQAEQTLAEYEATDKEEGTYTPDFYEIVEEEEILTEYEELLQKAMQTKSKEDCEALAKWFLIEGGMYWNDNEQAFKLEDGMWLREVNDIFDDEGNLVSCEWEID